MWGLQILLIGLWDSLVQRRSTECQLCDDNARHQENTIALLLPRAATVHIQAVNYLKTLVTMSFLWGAIKGVY